MGILLASDGADLGGSDFLARFATERMGTLRTLLYMQFIGFILLTSRSHGSAAGATSPMFPAGSPGLGSLSRLRQRRLHARPLPLI